MRRLAEGPKVPPQEVLVLLRKVASFSSVLAALSALLMAVPGCGRKEKQAPRPKVTNPLGADSAKPKQQAAGGRVAMALRSAVDDDARDKALQAFVLGWPRTRGALPAALERLRTDGPNRGGIALALARLGQPLVKPLIAMLERDPKDKNTLLAAGVLAYHLVFPGGLVKRTPAEYASLRAALAPTFAPLWAAFMADPRPDYEIYQGVAVGADEAIKRFRGPIPPGGLTRVGMVLYLVLSGLPNEVMLPAAHRKRLREQVVGLAGPMVAALTRVRADGSGESPDSLMIGLSVLGRATAVALAKNPTFRQPARCPFVVKTVAGLMEQFPASEAAPAKPLLTACATKAQATEARQQAKTLLAKLAQR